MRAHVLPRSDSILQHNNTIYSIEVVSGNKDWRCAKSFLVEVWHLTQRDNPLEPPSSCLFPLRDGHPATLPAASRSAMSQKWLPVVPHKAVVEVSKIGNL